jgi:hypothetical protein
MHRERYDCGSFAGAERQVGPAVAGNATLDQALGIELDAVALTLVDALGRDRQQARLEALDPALLAQVPEMKREMLRREVEELLEARLWPMPGFRMLRRRCT